MHSYMILINYSSSVHCRVQSTPIIYQFMHIKMGLELKFKIELSIEQVTSPNGSNVATPAIFGLKNVLVMLVSLGEALEQLS